MQPEYHADRGGVNAYHFVDKLTENLDDDAIIVTDVGFCFIPTFQSLRLKEGQRLIHSAGVSPMGWGIPAAVGAAMAAPGRQVVCLTGDGGAMMNIQELATIAHHKLPISIFVFENGGYATMKITQNNHFKREVMSGPQTGVGMPDFFGLAVAFGLSSHCIHNHGGLEKLLSFVLADGKKKPTFVSMRMAPDQVIKPRVQARTENGKFVPTPIDDMWPFIPRDDFTITEDANINDSRVDAGG